ncbi:MAG: 7TM domain-containing protein [Patescibacteria group bacterium]
MFRKYCALFIFLFCFPLSISIGVAHAQTVTPLIFPDTRAASTVGAESSSEANASAEAEASAAGKIQEKIQEKTTTDLTQTTGLVKSRLALLLDSHPIGPLSIGNFIQYLIRQAVDSGVPANMLVLMLMFPVVVSLIAVSRHVIGLEGFGVYGPAVLAVAFVSTGIVTGVLLFLVITAVALVGRSGFRQLKLQYLPRTALLVWFVSLIIFLLLVISPFFNGLVNLAAVGIFPILVLILLSENFVGSQISANFGRLAQVTFETILLSVSTAWLMGLTQVQDIVILHPEMTIIGVALLDMAVGKYTGLRVSEFFRFKPIMDQEE